MTKTSERPRTGQSLIKALMLLLPLTMPCPAFGSSVEGYVKKFAYSGSRVFVWVDSSRQGASCSTAGAGDRYELDQGNAGQGQLAILLTAYSMRQKIFISGTNACLIDTETVGYAETRP